MDWIVERLKEKSTYNGLTMLLGLVGYVVAPGALEVIGMGVAGVIGLVETFSKEPGSNTQAVPGLNGALNDQVVRVA